MLKSAPRVFTHLSVADILGLIVALCKLFIDGHNYFEPNTFTPEKFNSVISPISIGNDYHMSRACDRNEIFRPLNRVFGVNSVSLIENQVGH